MSLKSTAIMFISAACAAPIFADEAPTARKTDAQRPNILFIITDDHAVQAMGTCEKDSPIAYPHFNKLAKEGMVFDRSYCANSLCGPSRACILTGRHSHKNGYIFNEGRTPFDGSQPTYPKMLQQAGYQTAIFGKWHLESDPTGFDHWEIFPGQGAYYNPDFISRGQNGKRKVTREEGYATDLVTKKSIDWLEHRDKNKPFALVVGHKAPHRPWMPAERHLGKAKEAVSKLTPPASLEDNYANRPSFLRENEQTIARHMAVYSDLHIMKDIVPEDVRKKIVSPGYGWELGDVKRMNPAQRAAWEKYHKARTEELVELVKSGKIKTNKEMLEWRWRTYMEDYLGSILAVDDSIGELMDYLDKSGLSDNTLVIYCGDQGFYLGEHGLYDKRWIFEETFRMPLIMRWPGHIKPGVRSEAIVQNIDYAPTILATAGADTPENMKTFQGKSLVPLFATGESPDFKDRVIYYAFYENPGEHNAPRHDGLRTPRYTFARLWTSGEYMLFDNEKDPQQMVNVFRDPKYADIVKEIMVEYEKLRDQYEVPADSPGGKGTPIPKFTPSW